PRTHRAATRRPLEARRGASGTTRIRAGRTRPRRPTRQATRALWPLYTTVGGAAATIRAGRGAACGRPPAGNRPGPVVRAGAARDERRGGIEHRLVVGNERADPRIVLAEFDAEVRCDAHRSRSCSTWPRQVTTGNTG